MCRGIPAFTAAAALAKRNAEGILELAPSVLKQRRRAAGQKLKLGKTGGRLVGFRAQQHIDHRWYDEADMNVVLSKPIEIAASPELARDMCGGSRDERGSQSHVLGGKPSKRAAVENVDARRQAKIIGGGVVIIIGSGVGLDHAFRFPH